VYDYFCDFAGEKAVEVSDAAQLIDKLVRNRLLTVSESENKSYIY